MPTKVVSTLLVFSRQKCPHFAGVCGFLTHLDESDAALESLKLNLFTILMAIKQMELLLPRFPGNPVHSGKEDFSSCFLPIYGFDRPFREAKGLVQ